MKIKSTDTPVLVLGCSFAGIGVMRSLGAQGISVHGVEDDPGSPALASRYCDRRWIREFDARHPDRYLDFLLRLGNEIGARTLLIPTSDALAIFVSEHRDRLREKFLFADNEPELVRGLADKRRMLQIARESGISIANAEFPQDLGDVRRFSEEITFPVMVKGIRGDVLQEKTGFRMVIAESPDELIDWYTKLEDPAAPNLMLQEYIPGSDDQVYIFNGYFDQQSNCLAAFTGHKIRQFPIHVGCASLGRCAWNQAVADMTIDFMKKVGYHGILDIGYRLDPRDGLYKVLDVNPRIGGAFRMFVALNGMDVVRALYLDLTGQAAETVVPREGRRWIIEDYDLVSSYHYFKEGSLSLVAWLRSFRGVEEGKWFSWKDPMPFLKMSAELVKDIGMWVVNLFRPARKPSARSDP